MPNISLERESSVHPKYVEREEFYNYDIRAWLFDILIVVKILYNYKYKYSNISSS